MEIRPIIQSQYFAALEMLKQTIVKCPERLWNDPVDIDPCWQKAYHALFFCHMNLQNTFNDFRPWEKHHDPDAGVPFSQEEVLEYLVFVQKQVEEHVPLLDLEARSGFDWLPFDKLELQFFSIRHIQQHAGELYERLGSKANIEFDWVSQTPEYLRSKNG